MQSDEVELGCLARCANPMYSCTEQTMFVVQCKGMMIFANEYKSLPCASDIQPAMLMH